MMILRTGADSPLLHTLFAHCILSRNCIDCRHTRAHVAYWKSRLQSLGSPGMKRSAGDRGRANSPDDLYRATTCEETAKFERVASILSLYRLSLARWEQVDGSDRYREEEIELRWKALTTAEEMVVMLADKVDELTHASRQLFLIFTHELQRRGSYILAISSSIILNVPSEVDNGLERIYAFRNVRV